MEWFLTLPLSGCHLDWDNALNHVNGSGNLATIHWPDRLKSVRVDKLENTKRNRRNGLTVLASCNG